MPQPHALAATYSRMRSRCRLTQGGTCHSEGLSVDEKCQTQKVIFKSEKYATRVFRVVAFQPGSGGWLDKPAPPSPPSAYTSSQKRQLGSDELLLRQGLFA